MSSTKQVTLKISEENKRKKSKYTEFRKIIHKRWIHYIQITQEPNTNPHSEYNLLSTGFNKSRPNYLST